MCFIEERYARDLDCAGMLAYVFDGAVEMARSSVATAIESNFSQLKCLGKPQIRTFACIERRSQSQ